ncbi:Transcriptional regulatory protein ZraR [Aquicella siphonis]|uniref:Transcriptional regulatory protein ZraR n=1 Tax=Aquicella siphonis TaxID=254247 RepID=A0A5E4PJG3_9COXI|nr:sigma-54 dependent transcriptional regulator [Aquicella siphonis]VVC77104.1 Transcriptional regulatory protein ZraR [Aquicella siphonis]
MHSERIQGSKEDSLSRYRLVGDDCDSCRYLANAFALLKLPLDRLSVRHLIDSDHDNPQTTVFIFCKNIEEEQGKRLYEMLASDHRHFISMLPPEQRIVRSKSLVHFLKSSFSASELINILARCGQTDSELNTPTNLTSHPVFERLIGSSLRIRKIRSMIHQVACTDSTVLILGQSGTGKDVIASCIHYLSKRCENALVPINCGAIPGELIESELFGHEKGAFTGALTRRPGRFEIANGGTLFLDEIGDMPLSMQVKLLRVIQERKIDRVGGNTSINVNVRLIAATNKNLEDLIQQNRFREDLFYRLNVFPIQVPSLNERKEDIPVLIDYHLNKIHERLGHRVAFTETAMQTLCDYAWPGNIRELENFLERTVILHRDQVLDEKDIDPAYKQKKNPAPASVTALSEETPLNIKDYIANIEKQVIQFALNRSNGMIQSAADYLSLGKNALLEKMKKHNLIDA